MSETSKSDVKELEAWANFEKLQAENRKLNSEKARLDQLRRWYPAVIVLAALAAGAAIGKLL